MLEAYMQALGNFTSLPYVLAVLAGAVVGIIFGIIPAIGAPAAVALFLPLAFGKDPILALGFVAAIFASSSTGGSVTAVVLGIPGDVVNAATVLDGYPMTCKGQGSRAIGAAVGSETVGGLFSPIMALAMVPLLVPMIMALRTSDMVFLVVMGLVFIAVLSQGSAIKGLIAAGIGFLIAFVGYHAGTGIHRYDFGLSYLYEGLALAPVILGLYALPEVIILMAGGTTIAPGKTVLTGLKDVFEGVKDVFRHWTVCLRGTIIGYIIGVVPGVGGMTSIFVAYGQAKETSKYPEKFGTGVVEGVIAPESAIGAEHAGDILTTVALGIPGSGSMAILLGAFIVVGLTPGPSIMIDHLDIGIWILLAALGGTLLAGAIVLFLGRYLLKLAVVPGRILAPIILAAVYAGVFAYQENIGDLIVLTAVGIVGLLATLGGFNRSAMLLAFVLGRLFEKYLFLSVKLHGPLFWARPISIGLILVTIAILVYQPVMNRLKEKRKSR